MITFFKLHLRDGSDIRLNPNYIESYGEYTTVDGSIEGTYIITTSMPDDSVPYVVKEPMEMIDNLVRKLNKM